MLPGHVLWKSKFGARARRLGAFRVARRPGTVPIKAKLQNHIEHMTVYTIVHTNAQSRVLENPSSRRVLTVARHLGAHGTKMA